MASLAESAPSGVQRERRFYLIMALLFAAESVAGFSLAFAIGMSSFGAPWWVHVHAVTMTAFLALYVAQNWLVWRGELAAHRKLGAVGAVLGLWLIAYGCWAITMTLAAGRQPPFFTPAFFLLMDWMNMAVFAGLAGAGLALRARADWHKRLMFGAMLSLISVAWGRLVLPPLFDQRGTVLILAALLAHLAAAMLLDRRLHGRVHPAHWWTGGALVAWLALTFAVADNPAWVAFSQSFAG
ncbi:hypothetical protein [Alteraurantiacibacter buctensis]|uniref:Uncharacterized protein n=1 Tax=Alteraurantiacibacter buctensis TaxID=1503981 RepID=A0A844Z126_9SPHN|nr:hypothetical protein [Alteraurantiacibacter buctensis]MXO73222.1 hypothetical protein [Alteraurantiacibacter buctensis]